ncbi:MAG: outer membrane lipoprotein-sorting protein [SAR324 cluster bacterium]|nr:outer membrane lipoprotein-sorting protein [SAR324 cluster bacterium]
MKKKWLSLSLLLCASSVLLCGSIAFADQQVDDLLDRVDRLYRSDKSYSEVEMEITTPDWQRTMKMRMWSRGMEDTLIEILAPVKDAGVKTLKLDNQMWNFLPKIGRVIKVPPSMMMNSWMGSDFTNDDLVKENTLKDDYVSQLLPHPIDPDLYYYIELHPQPETVTVWGKVTLSIRKDDLLPVEYAYFDERGEKIRTMSLSDVREMGGKKIPAVMEMRTLQKNSRTIIRYLNMEFNPQFEDDLFSFSNLRRR